MDFDIELCVKYVKSLIEHDEVERALLVLDNVPAYYRDNRPKELINLKQDILKALCTVHAYMDCDLDANVSLEKAKTVLKNTVRGVLLEGEVKRYNEQGLVPHIVDVGPGEYFAPIGLNYYGYQFTYKPVSLDRKARLAANEFLKHIPSERVINSPQIYLALEIIEHLPSTQDLVAEALRNCNEFPDRIHLSTPLYTYDTNHPEWNKDCGLPHLRAYTPHEFIQESNRLFPGYDWQLYDDKIMSLRGLRRDRPDPKPL